MFDRYLEERNFRVAMHIHEFSLQAVVGCFSMS